MPHRRIDHALVQQQIRDIRAATYCKVCGTQPIHWHNPDHASNPRRRISNMMHKYSLEDILDEIMLCTPLCAKCHRKEHPHRTPSRRATYWNKITT